MKQTIDYYQFKHAFQKCGRENNFSYRGLYALFNYLEEYENDTGEEIELDVIALCCDYAEYDSLEEFRNDYGEDYQTIEDIEKRTIVILKEQYFDNDNGFIIQQF